MMGVLQQPLNRVDDDDDIMIPHYALSRGAYFVTMAWWRLVDVLFNEPVIVPCGCLNLSGWHYGASWYGFDMRQ